MYIIEILIREIDCFETETAYVAKNHHPTVVRDLARTFYSRRMAEEVKQKLRDEANTPDFRMVYVEINIVSV